MFISYYCSDGSIRSKLVNAAFILGYLGVLLAGYIKKNHYHYIRLILLILCAELGVSTMHTIRQAFTGMDMLSIHDIYTINEINKMYYDKDDSLVKASLPTQDASNMACIAGFNSVDIFTSSLQQEQIYISDAWNIEHGYNYLSYEMGNPMADLAFKVKGFYLYDGISSSNIPSYLEKKTSLNSVVLYEDVKVPDIGILFPSEIKDVDVNDFETAFDYQNHLSQLLVGVDLYDIIDLTEQIQIEEDLLYEQNEEATNDKQKDDSADSFDCVISNAGSNINYLINKEDNMHDLFVSTCNRIQFAGNVDHIKDNTISVPLQLADHEASKLEREGFGSISAASLNKDTLELIKEYLNTKCISNLKADNFGISGDITVDYDGYVFIPTFMYDGWKTTVDGTEVKTEKILGGTGIPVTKGKHSIKISKLHQVNMKQYYLTIASLIIFVMIIIVLKMKFSSEKKTKQ